MRKLLNKPWFVALLAITAIGLIGLSLVDRSSGGPARMAQSAVEPDLMGQDDHDESVEPDATGAPQSVVEALAALVFPAELRDPFARREPGMVAGEPETAGVATEQTESIHLSAIWSQAGATLVLVNDRILRAGDVVGRITIESVNLDGVWVKHWQGRNFVALGGDFILATPVRDTVTALLSP